MRKITKDLSVINIPKTLTKGTTKSKRFGVIANGYPKKSTSSDERAIKKAKKKVKEYDGHFKGKDILDSLDAIYNSKCAYCEGKINRVNKNNIKNILDEENHSVEHYRPKSIYPWLVFSWDNLLWCCIQCNKNKWNEFATLNEEIKYDESFKENIHSSTQAYNLEENPKMIHPELEDVMDKLTFDTNGNIDSEDDRVKYTITACRLDRDYLNGKRKEIWDDFEKKIQDSIIQNNKDLRDKIIKEFKENSENMDNEFIAFRIWILNR